MRSRKSAKLVPARSASGLRVGAVSDEYRKSDTFDALVAEVQRLREEEQRLQAENLLDREQFASERRRLAKAERDARAANAAKDQFIATLSYELRAPFSSILAAVSALMARQDLPADVQGTFAVLQRNVVAEAKLIDDLLDATRVSRAKLQIEKRPLDAHRAVREGLDPLRSEIQRKNQMLVMDLDARLSWVEGDFDRLRQVFWNVVSNAVKFTPEGGRIEVCSWNHGPHLVVEVSDTGRGIDRDALDRLFAPFEQSLDERPPSPVGLGLGLAISRGILELHGAQIAASSAGRGMGARFRIDLATIDEPGAAGSS